MYGVRCTMYASTIDADRLSMPVYKVSKASGRPIGKIPYILFILYILNMQSFQS